MSTIARLPVYLLLDTSGSMRGEPIAAINVGLASLFDALRQDRQTAHRIHLSVITFDVTARVVMPLTALSAVQWRPLSVPEAGATFLGAALTLLLERMAVELVPTDGHPMVFVMTDGSPSDSYALQQASKSLKHQSFSDIIGCAVGPKAKTAALKQFAQTVITLEHADAHHFSTLLHWVEQGVQQHAQSVHLPTHSSAIPNLPPPPPEIQIVL